MLTTIAYGLAIVLNIFCVFIGARFLLVPRPAAAGYGVPATTDIAYLTIKGTRDTTYGILGLALLLIGGAEVEAWFMVIAALLPLGDTLIVLRHGGAKVTAFGVHFATAVVMFVSAGLLFAS